MYSCSFGARYRTSTRTTAVGPSTATTSADISNLAPGSSGQSSRIAACPTSSGSYGDGRYRASSVNSRATASASFSRQARS